MNIKPVASPSAIQQAPSNAAQLRAKAVAAFQQAAQPASQQPPQQIVQNQTQVSAEEMSAITSQTRQPDTSEEIQAVTAEETQAPEAKPEETQVDPALSRQFAQLARQEKALRAKVQQLQQQEQAFKAKEAAIQAREQELTSKSQIDMSKYISRDQLKQDALATLAEVGVSYEEITQQALTQQPTDPRLQRTISQLQQQIEELKAANETSKQSYAEQQTQAYQAAVRQIEMDAKALVKADPITYEAISKTGTVKEVVKLIEEAYKKDGVLMTIEEAAQEIENYLVEENYNMANKIEKIKRKMQTVAPAASTSTAQTPAGKPQTQTQPMKTLTNAASSTRQLSAKERAILAFKGELKS